jgi:two-component system CheB/CheR fusion protein
MKVPTEWRRPIGTSFNGARASRTDTVLPDVQLLESALNELGTALVVVENNGAVALANMPARLLLGVGQADIGRPFQDLPISYRPIELRGPIDEVFRSRSGVQLQEQEFRINQDEVMQLTIDIRPLQRADGSVHAVLLAFHDHTRIHGLQRELEASQENLEQSIEELQSSNEELETTNEELQSTNEELETTNEELQSTNEELETLNEEARSSNEEMESINEELRIQAEQSAGYRLHLESVLRAMNGGIIVLDHRHHIQSWNRWSENTWGLRAEEVLGGSFDTLDIGIPIHQLLETMAPVQSGEAEYAEVQLEGMDRRGRRILCRIRMTALLDESGDSHGVVLVFQDITEKREKEEFARYLGRIMGRALNEIYFLDPLTLQFRLTNEGAQKKLGFAPAQLAQMTLTDVLPGLAADDLRALIGPLLSGQEPEIVFETTIRTAAGSEYPAQLCMQYFADEVPPILVAIGHDTSERKQLLAAAE